jgi:nucleotide sugar dehydrogenase
MKTVCVVGLGYVGLPLACITAEKGYRTYGLDINRETVELTLRGISHIKDHDLEKDVARLKGKIHATTDAKEAVTNSDIIIVCVPTPIDRNNKPDLEPVISSSKMISKNLKKGQLIVVESTIYPGVIEEVVQPILEESGLNAEKDFYLAHCPERIDLGNKKWDVRTIPRVVGALSEKGLKKAAEFYRSILDSGVYELSSVKAAEATKVTENAFRDVNIAFVNELAKSFDKMGIDALEVIRAASTKPFGFMAHYPGAGVGGHCIPVDPYYLIEKAKCFGFTHKFLILAREINSSMPEYTVELLDDALHEIGKSVKGARVGVLGVAYKGGVDDIRESPALEIIKILKRKGAKLYIFDPYVKGESNVNTMDKVLEKSECLVLVTDHPEFKSMNLEKAKKKGIKVIIDGRNVLDKEKIKSLGILYRGIGRR